jgi:hypothetical protein
MFRALDHYITDKPHTAAGVARLSSSRPLDLACVTGTLEASVIAKMRSGQREFEPDPVPAVHSVREDVSMERNQKMGRHMIAGMNCLVHAGRECSLTCRKTHAHWEVPLCR